MKPSIILAILTMLMSCQNIKCGSRSVKLYMEPPYSKSNEDGYWSRIDADKTGLSKKALLEHIELCKETGASSQLVLFNGKIVSEWYSEEYTEPVGAMSSTKVVASILVGQLVDEGLLDYDMRVSDILKTWSGGYRDEVTIRQLLTHSAGFHKEIADGKNIGYASNKRDFVLKQYPEGKPGVKFEYSNEGIQLLEPIIYSIVKEDTARYAKMKLFDELGMNDTRLYEYGDSAWLYSEMKTTPRDMARIGLLMKRNGAWEGKQIVSPEYVATATSPSKTSKVMGFAWWILDPGETLKGYYASGYLNNDIYVFSDYDLIIVRTQAPKKGYSGKNESGDYFKRAMRIFKKIVNEK